MATMHSNRGTGADLEVIRGEGRILKYVRGLCNFCIRQKKCSDTLLFIFYNENFTKYSGRGNFLKKKNHIRGKNVWEKNNLNFIFNIGCFLFFYFLIIKTMK